MCKLGEIIGKNVISLWTAENLGRLKNAVCDDKLKKVLGFETENGAFFTPDALLFVGSDALTVENSSDTIDNGSPFPINVLVYSVSGKLLGAVTDLEFKGDKIIAVCVGEESFDGNKILARSNEIIVINDTQKRIVKKSEKATPLPQEQVKQEGVTLPQKIKKEDVSYEKRTSYDFLLGKRMTRTLSSASGETLAYLGDEITEEIIANAEKEGKLVQLALHSK